MSSGFVHLRAHSEYSIHDGALRIDEYVAAASRDGQESLALTDAGNLFAAVKFYRACMDAGIKPILGADVEMAQESARRPAMRLLLLCADHTGYRNLCRLLSDAWIEGQDSKGVARLRWAWLERSAQGLIALSGAFDGVAGALLRSQDWLSAEAALQSLVELFPQRFYLEVQRAGRNFDEPCLQASLQLALRHHLPLVATHPVQFLRPGDYDLHEAKVCIDSGTLLSDSKRARRFSAEQYFVPSALMQERFKDTPFALTNAAQIAQRCNLQLRLGAAQMPAFPLPQGVDADQHLRGESYRLLPQRLSTSAQTLPQRYAERLDTELAVIAKTGFAGYFLIVADFTGWARRNHCPVGPGRGSGPGSLVAYALGITDLDPLRYGLLFERFLNPERVSLPDFDIDFCPDNRERVIDYVRGRYGHDAVSQIATFGVMAAKAAVRDAGRVLGNGYGFTDSLAKLLTPPQRGMTVTLAQRPEIADTSVFYARFDSPELKKREQDEEDSRELLHLAARLEGMVRNVGMHAGGVIIAPGAIADYCPLYRQPDSGAAVAQFDKEDVGAVGLVKFDLLGLSTLTILELIQTHLRQEDPEFSFSNLATDDPEVLALFARGDTEAVFQFESPGMRRLLREAQPDRFEDLVALNALYRPGPMELIPDFCDRKRGKAAVQYPDESVKPILQETYGIMVYQEQVMQIAQSLAGFTLGAADTLRRAMSSKQKSVFEQQRARFLSGAESRGFSRQAASAVFDLIEKFAGYGFNKAHAASYALLAYHTAWAKRYHPAAFYAANMTVEQHDTDVLKLLFDDARRHAVTFLPPSLMHSGSSFLAIGAKQVRYGLGAIRGTGDIAVSEILRARSEAPFKDFVDFLQRVDRQKINKRVCEVLIKSGACDDFGQERHSSLANLEPNMRQAELQQSLGLQNSFFALDEGVIAMPQQQAGAPWSTLQRLKFEAEALGFPLSGHWFDAYAAEIRRFAPTELAQLQPDSHATLLAAGIVQNHRRFLAAGGKPRIIFNLSDPSGQYECVLQNERSLSFDSLIQENQPLVILGTLSPDRSGGEPSFRSIQQAWNLPAARCNFAQCALMRVSPKPPPSDFFEKLRQALQVARKSAPYGSATVALRVLVQAAPGVFGELALGDDANFWPSDNTLAALRALPGCAELSLLYRDSAAA